MNKLLMNKILIANRGEIACRIIRTAQKMSLKTVGVYSDADRDSKYVSMADEAYYIGSNTLSDSYINMQKILDITKKSKAHAIHPGYGFLSENSKFVDLCEKNNVIFIGPPSKAINAMGSKSESKRIMEKANVPVVAGYHGDNQDDKFLFEEAKKIGFPVLIKAVMGGGGKGMRTVFDPNEFFNSLDAARRESMKSFGDDKVIVEKFIELPKHIEVQVFGDKYNNYVYMFERDCSIQRRHQKIIEEAPSYLTPEKRILICENAVKAAKAVGYYNAGTVEFIYDTLASKFYFMEMNTRLQVEHPISEEITGQDFVEWQFRVARGEKLPLTQDQLKINGHSIEARVYAEDPDTEFLPQSGKIYYLREPVNRESDTPDNNVRVETGVRQGDVVSIFFDPMVSKLVVHGKDRLDAITRMHKALLDYKIVGLKNNITFLMKILQEKAFIDNDYCTDFIKKYGDSLFESPFTHVLPEGNDILHSTLIELMVEKRENEVKTQHIGSVSYGSPWHIQDSFRINYKYIRKLKIVDEQKVSYNLEIKYNSSNDFEIRIVDGEFKTDFKRFKCKFISKNYIEIESDEDKKHIEFFVDSESKVHTMRKNGGIVVLKILVDDFRELAETSSSKYIKAPMPGKIVKVFLKSGDSVKKGQQILSLESMKMEYIIKANKDAVIKEIYAAETNFVQIGAKLVEFTE